MSNNLQKIIRAPFSHAHHLRLMRVVWSDHALNSLSNYLCIFEPPVLLERGAERSGARLLPNGLDNLLSQTGRSLGLAGSLLSANCHRSAQAKRTTASNTLRTFRLSSNRFRHATEGVLDGLLMESVRKFYI